MSDSKIPDPKLLIDQVLQLSIEAGREILHHYRSGFSVEYKSNRSPVTVADNSANDIIDAGLRRLKPLLPILSEESALPEYSERSIWPHYWLVDPLDGTSSFIRRGDQFTVNIALVEGHSTIMGVVHSPIENRTYWGIKGDGASCLNGADGSVQRIQVRNFSGGNARVIAPVSRGHRLIKTFIDNLESGSIECDVSNSSSSIKFCRVAEGAADVYPSFTNTSEWDTAAAQCVLECAGGKVVDTEGNTVIYNKPSLKNPKFLASGGGDIDWVRFV